MSYTDNIIREIQLMEGIYFLKIYVLSIYIVEKAKKCQDADIMNYFPCFILLLLFLLLLLTLSMMHVSCRKRGRTGMGYLLTSGLAQGPSQSPLMNGNRLKQVKLSESSLHDPLDIQ